MDELAVRLHEITWAAAKGRPPPIHELTYHSVVEFFVENKKRAPTAVCGALVREARRGGSLVRLFYMDGEGRALVGGEDGAPHRSYIARSFDEMLASLIKDKNVVIFT
ncbi:hypothetical protein [Frankia sp. CiP3]|uniref:hypothetical protein n=1 Tax=Frankia sp. CiP3 TaxID=2880971 RepID=UPI001EF46583|nr:hypothetical protein [Frankia sp. CiP3]